MLFQRLIARMFSLTIAIITCTVPFCTMAADKSTSLNTALNILFSNNPIQDAELRVIANNIENSCRQYRSRVPSLSPREIDWVNKEMNGGRMITIMQMPEFSRWMLSNMLDSCIENAYAAGSLPKDASMPFWVKLSLELRNSDNSFYVEKLSKEKVISFKDDDTNTIGAIYSMTGEKILSAILLLWLESRTP